MSIKSDHWIRRMAEKEKMIEPFAPEQVRSSDGHKIVSYGTSSYGYDVRCSREFKIFTNINSTIVDPKAFDEKSFVDITADVPAGLLAGVTSHVAERLRGGAGMPADLAPPSTSISVGALFERTATEDVLWTLLNTKEFLYNH